MWSKFRKGKKLNFGLILVLIFFAWLIFSFLIWPNLSVLRETFVKDGSISTRAIEKVSKSKRALTGITNSFMIGIVLSFTVNIVGIFIVLITEYYKVWGAKILRIAFMSTLVFGGLLLNNGYLLVYGQNGIVTNMLNGIIPNFNKGWFIGAPAVIFVMTFACTSNHMLFFRNAVKSIDFQTIQAAENLGADQWTILTKVVLPQFKPTLTTLTVMAFQTGLGAMAAPLMVGGEGFRTISPLILDFAKRVSSRDIAAVLALLLGISQMILLMIMTRNERRGSYLSISKTKTKIEKVKIHNPLVNTIVHILAWLLFVIYSLPIFMVVLFSFMPYTQIAKGVIDLSKFTFENYAKVLGDASVLKPFITSVIYSGLASFTTVFLMIVVAWIVTKYKTRIALILEYAFYIPWLVPSLFIALGLILGYSQGWPWLFNNVLVGSLIILLIAYIINTMPSTLRYIKSSLLSLDPNLENASRNLGASSFRTLVKVIVPVILPTALALFALNFNGLLADYDLSAFLYHPTAETLGIMIRKNADPMASVDARAINLVYSVVLMIISTIVMYLVYGRGFDRKKKSKISKIDEKEVIQKMEM